MSENWEWFTNARLLPLHLFYGWKLIEMNVIYFKSVGWYDTDGHVSGHTSSELEQSRMKIGYVCL